MAIFILRIQLTKESRPHYTLLRDKLLNIGFTKRIKSKQGIEYRLPNGNYLVDSNTDIDAIYKAVEKIVLSIDKTPMILLSETKDNTWYGLQIC
jgi:dephospho-CoA kinase